MDNIVIDNLANPTLVRVLIKASKTGKGVSTLLATISTQLHHSMHTWLPKASKVQALSSVSRFKFML